MESKSKIKEVQTKGMQSGFTTDIREKEISLVQEFNQREHHEEIYWNQKARVKWLHEGE